MFNQLVVRLKNENVSSSILTTIATMTLPFSGHQFLELFPLVYEKCDNDTRSKIVNSVNDIDNAIKEEYLLSIEGKKALLFYYDLVKSFAEENDAFLLVTILRNPNCSDEIYFRAASSSSKIVHDFLVNNQILLQNHPIILDLLIDNEEVFASSKEKLKEYVKFGIVKGTSIDSLYAQKEIKPKYDKDNINLEQTTQVVDDEESVKKIIEDAEEQKKIEIDKKHNEEIIKELDNDELSIYQQLLKLTVSQKIDRALKGNKEERNLLIRDSNKMISRAVINSPKLTEQEAIMFASLRNIHRDILREMGKNRNFIKKYKIVLNLVKNPKTPQDIVMRLIPRLTDRDIKLILKDRALPEFLRKNALRISKTRKKQ